MTGTVKHPTLDRLAAFCTAFQVDWDTEPADDGYTDLWGRAPLHEPVFFSDWLDEQQTPSAPARPRVYVLPGKKRA